MKSNGTRDPAGGYKLSSTDDFLRLLEDSPPLTEENRAQLRALLNGEVLQQALGEVIRRLQEQNVQFLSLDFTLQQGVSKAINLQGKLEGAMMALESLYSLAQTKEDE